MPNFLKYLMLQAPIIFHSYALNQDSTFRTVNHRNAYTQHVCDKQMEVKVKYEEDSLLLSSLHINYYVTLANFTAFTFR